MDRAKNAREYAHACIEAADMITTTATRVLRSLRRGNDDWSMHFDDLMIWADIIGRMPIPEGNDDAEDARTEEA